MWRTLASRPRSQRSLSASVALKSAGRFGSVDAEHLWGHFIFDHEGEPDLIGNEMTGGHTA